MPYRNPYLGTLRWFNSLAWYNWVYAQNRDYVYANWIFYPATGYNNGYYQIDNYPYYVYNGYRYRYSSQDTCNYQLVDQYNHQVIQSYWNQMCNTGYDQCSITRDQMNDQAGEYRYFCSETIQDENYDYSTPTYEDYQNGDYQTEEYPQDETSSDCEDVDNDGYCD